MCINELLCKMHTLSIICDEFCLPVYMQCRSGLATVPDNSKVHYNYANFLKDSERFEEAIRHYRVSIRLSPDHAQSHNNLGTLLDGKEAELHFREAVRHNPQHHKAFYNLGRNLEYVQFLFIKSMTITAMKHNTH